MKKKIYVATYENSYGEGTLKIFSSKKEANAWLRKTFIKDFLPDVADLTTQDINNAFWSHKQYGAFCCRIWTRTK